jgi:hypothetical protein
MDDTLRAELLGAAKSAVHVRKMYLQLKRDPTARYFTYVLLLQNGNIYVGSSDNIIMRLYEHEFQTPQSAQFVREHGPVIRVMEIAQNSRADDETYKTLEYMSLFGWERVRGAGWCRGSMRGPPGELASFRRDRTDFEYLSRADIDEILSEIARL